MLEADAGWVAAVQSRCATCEDRDRQTEKAKTAKDWFGRRVRFKVFTDPVEAGIGSARARYTQEGASERASLLKRRRRVG